MYPLFKNSEYMSLEGKFIIPLKDLEDKLTDYEYHLDEEFFKSIDQEEILSGDLDARVYVKKTVDAFELDIEIDGDIVVTCQRCLDELTLPIYTEEHLVVRYGDDKTAETDELVIIPESEGVIDMSWYLYEFIGLNIPILPVHEEGECNEQMEELLEKYSPNREKEDIDPRWEGLKNLINNNN